MRETINLIVRHNGTTCELKTYSQEYRSLMELLKDRIPLEGFGECGGQGRCATCIIKAIGIRGYSAIKERNEPRTLSRFNFHDPSFRLSCQLSISTDLEMVEIELLET